MTTKDTITTASTITPRPVLLSDLCRFCNAKLPKYRCPACDARSCSLSCSKRHKVYNQCTGVRDPTKFVRRSELHSPIALDRDYNYLTAVERTLNRPPILKNTDNDGAEKEDGGRKPGVDDRRTRHQLTQSLNSRGIQLRSAPVSLKRARDNRTALVG